MIKTKITFGFMIFLAMIALKTQQTNASPTITYDIIIHNGTVVDGSGSKAYQADIAINNNEIIAIGELKKQQAKKSIQGDNLIIAPGFIDLHSHADYNILHNPDIENNIRQGITTVLAGNCGSSPVQIDDYMQQLEAKGISLNMALLIGHNSIRSAVMGRDNRVPTTIEQEKMQTLTKKAMQDGAFGLSTGLKYVPGVYAKTDEIIGLAKVVKQYNGFYATHMREEGLHIMASIDEALTIGRQAGLPVHISHHKIVGKSMWGKSKDTLLKIAKARETGLDVSLDQYPYTASSTKLSILFPAWALAGGQKEIIKRLDNKKLYTQIKESVIANLLYDRGGGDPARVLIASFSTEPTYEGKSLKEITQLKGRRATIENAAITLMELIYAGGGQGIFKAMHENDIVQIMKAPYVSIATDGSAVTFGENVPHPRNYGTFARVLRKYVREDNALTLESAIHKMTGLPAQRLGIKNRGLIKEKMIADIVIFDRKKINDPATWENPHQYTQGISYVIVNGQLVIDNDKRTRHYPGKVLKKHSF